MPKKDKERKRTTSCGGVVWRFRDEKFEVLLIKQFAHKDSWGIPKGHVDSGETIEACACREIMEETGVAVTLEERLPDVIAPYRKEKKTVKSWLARPIGNDVPRGDHPDNEVAEARWFPVDSLPTIHKYQRSLLTAAINALASKVPNLV